MKLLQRFSRALAAFRGVPAVAPSAIIRAEQPAPIVTSYERYLMEATRDSDPAVRALAEAHPQITAVKARYEAAWFSPNRTWLQSYVQGSKQDISSFSRREVARRVRWFEKNNAIAQKILDLIETNAVGTGLNPTPCSSDETWNAIVLGAWNKWTDSADFEGLLDYYQMQAVGIRARCVDGEVFRRHVPTEQGPRIQLIEMHRVVGGFDVDAGMRETHEDFDGVLIEKKTGRITHYHVDNGNGTAAVIPASEIVHDFEASRPSQYRGISLFHAVTNDLHDLDDLQVYSMLASKDAAGNSFVVKTKTGEMPAALIGDGNTVAMTPASPEEKAAYYHKHFGARTYVTQIGDEVEQADNIRPSESERALYEILERRVCRGVGISYAAVRDYEGNLGGTALRAALVADNRFYECRTASLIRGVRRDYKFWLTSVLPVLAKEYALKSGGKAVPADFDCVTIHPPKRPTVDIGRDANATLSMLRVGNETLMGLAGESGGDWRANLKQKAKEISYAKKLAEEVGVPLELLYSLDSGERAAAVSREKPADPSSATG